MSDHPYAIFLDGLTAMSADAADATIDSMTDAEILAWWSWHDSEAASYIRDLRLGRIGDDSIDEAAYGYRESLRDLVACERAA